MVRRKQVHKITIKDVAQASNVSTQTVSRVINKRPDVSPETREAVEKTIAKMGYQPSALARSLVQQRSYTLGVITTGLKYLGVSQALTGITHQCDADNYALLIKELARFGEPNIVPVIESLMTRHVEGIIFAGPEWNENVKVAQSQLPSFCPPIIFLKCQPTPQYTTLSIDNYGGARMAVDHLLALGRHRIGLITGPLEWLESRQRKQGWEDGLRNVGIEVAPQHWSEGNWSSASGEAAFAELLEKYPGMNAVFASNDQMALGAFHLAHQHGLRIPEDIAFIGFDNLAEGAFFTPALTTIEQPLEELGRLAVKTLLAQIEGSDTEFSGNTIVLPTRLVIRESTAKAGAAA
jgi:DNA-binding LacI/PurR family transcriptional regulator